MTKGWDTEKAEHTIVYCQDKINLCRSMAETLYGVKCGDYAGSLRLKATFTISKGVWPFQPTCSTGKLPTQAVFLPDERRGDILMTHRSSGVGDTSGKRWNDPRYSNVFAKLMSCYSQAASVKGTRRILASSLYGRHGGFYLQVPLCHRVIKMDISGGGPLWNLNLPLNGSGEL